MADIIYQATGRRKTSVARVTMKPGSGELKVNGRDLDDYFSYDTLIIKAPTPACIPFKIKAIYLLEIKAL